AALVARHQPTVVVQAASVQTSAVIAETGDGWSRLVAEGGLSATAGFQALLTATVARAGPDEHPPAQPIKCCFSAVVSGMIASMGLPVTCGTGNVAILANAFAGALIDASERVQVLAHYQTIGPWRRSSTERSGPAPRVWISGEEATDVFTR